MAARQPAPVAPLIPNTVPPTRTLPPGFDEQRTLPPGFEEHVQLHQILHSSNDQSVAGLQLTPAGLAPAVQHGQQAVTPLAYEPHGSAAPEACFQPSVQSQHFLCAVQQPYSNPYYLEEGHQSYFPENPSLPPQAPCNRSGSAASFVVASRFQCPNTACCIYLDTIDTKPVPREHYDASLVIGLGY